MEEKINETVDNGRQLVYNEIIVLPREKRIGKKMFKEVFQKSRQFSSQYFFARVSKIQEADRNAFACVISSKISKKAVVRNLLKRRITHVIRENINKIQLGLGIIIFPKKGAEELEFEAIKQDLLKLFKSIKL